MQAATFALTAVDVSQEPLDVELDRAFLPPWQQGKALPSKVPVVRLFGVSPQGWSVCAHVHGFCPHFFVELSESTAASLTAGPPGTTALANPSQLASAIEAAAGRRQTRVVGLRVERYRSIYGLRLDDSPFLRVDFSHPSDVSLAAAGMQRGDVAALGLTQPHEAHIPFLFQFMATHHICGAGWVHVTGIPRRVEIPGHEGGHTLGRPSIPCPTGTLNARAPQSCCYIELDVDSTLGFPSHAENAALMAKVGPRADARAKAYLRAMIDHTSPEAQASRAKHRRVGRQHADNAIHRSETERARPGIDQGHIDEDDTVSTFTSPPSRVANTPEEKASLTPSASTPTQGAMTQLFKAAAQTALFSRPNSGGKTTVAAMRKALATWLLGGEPPSGAANEAEALAAQKAQASVRDAIQSMAVVEPAAGLGGEKTSNLTDVEDLCSPEKLEQGKGEAALHLVFKPIPEQPTCQASSDAKSSLYCENTSHSGSCGASPQMVSGPKDKTRYRMLAPQGSHSVPATAASIAPLDPPSTPPRSQSNVVVAAMMEPEWEDVCCVFALEAFALPESGSACSSDDPTTYSRVRCEADVRGSPDPTLRNAPLDGRANVKASMNAIDIAFSCLGADPLVAVSFAYWPHTNGRSDARIMTKGVFVVAGAPFQADAACDIQVVATEDGLFEALVQLVRRVDPDICLGWNLTSGSWGRLYARAHALGRGLAWRLALSRAPFGGGAVAEQITHQDFVASRKLDLVASSVGEGRDYLGNSRSDGCGQAQGPVKGSAGSGGAGERAEMSAIDSEMIAASELQVAGRIVLNVWRILVHVTFGTKLRNYTPQEVARELLGTSVPMVNSAEFARLWKSCRTRVSTLAESGISDLSSATETTAMRREVMGHLQVLTELSLRAMEKLAIFARVAELSRLTGMDLLSSFTRGTQIGVESLMRRVARAAGFLLLSPSSAQVGGQPALERIPLVMEPESGYYWDPVLVLDFKSMYPSIIIAHNISYDTCLGRAHNVAVGPTCRMGVLADQPWRLGAPASVLRLGQLVKESFEESVAAEGKVLAEQNDCPLRVLPGRVLVAAPQVQHGILPVMLAEVLRLRFEAKAQMKTASGARLQRLDSRQFALKYFANVTYGYTGASFSGRMPCSEVADAIVGSGRQALDETTNFIEAAIPGARVIYGDTDSVFVQLPGVSLEQAFQVGRRLSGQISSLHPPPMELEFEKVYFPAFCATKKRYAGLMYSKPPSEGGEARFEAKGLEVVRRDQCRFASDAQKELLDLMFRTRDISVVRRRFEQIASTLLQGSEIGPSLMDLCFQREVRFGTYRAEDADGGHALLPPQAALAKREAAAAARAAAHPRGVAGVPAPGGKGSHLSTLALPAYGERVAYCMAASAPGTRLNVRACPPEALVEGGARDAADSALRLDRWWYAEKALLPAIRKVFHGELVGLPSNVNVSTWLHHVRRPSEATEAAAWAAGRPRDGSRGAILGGLSGLLRRLCRECHRVEAAVSAGVCGGCASDELREDARLKAVAAEQKAEALREKCIACAGPRLWQSCTAAASCPTFTWRAAAAEASRRAAEEARALLHRTVQYEFEGRSTGGPSCLTVARDVVEVSDSPNRPDAPWLREARDFVVDVVESQYLLDELAPLEATDVGVASHGPLEMATPPANRTKRSRWRRLTPTTRPTQVASISDDLTELDDAASQPSHADSTIEVADDVMDTGSPPHRSPSSDSGCLAVTQVDEDSEATEASSTSHVEAEPIQKRSRQ